MKKFLDWLIFLLERPPKEVLAEDETDVSPKDFAKTKAALSLVEVKEVVIVPEWNHDTPTLGQVIREGQEQSLQASFVGKYEEAITEAYKEDVLKQHEV